ncbi:MAG: tRNA (N(6)-L-threonylcarbamoyladenosine(37)-C(2))-methylthiotransferase MtaB [Candidatus Adiutrix intracellularis]|jgi:threonylcarbamoyladenosine tRNA methylthiotransferase MtaB|nr:tRNA (N(6)-L-threonylcarbamoyladenosine(37)-C(2))-methylthiotransferase MtaB [Candidatus Adiutrix intracellularis]
MSASESCSQGRPTAVVLTLGCKVNQFESSALAENLIAAGYELVVEPVGADLVVLNTCTVTEKADQEALALIRRLKRLAPAVKIVVTGCLAQVNPALLAETGLVELVLRQDEKKDLIRHLGVLEIPDGRKLVRVTSPGGWAAGFSAPASERTRVFYKIQDGCSAFCTYCVVPLSRGAPRSLDLDQVLEGLRSYLVRGLAEVVICGIHLGQWGRDLNPPLSLAELLHTIEAEITPYEETFRLRLSSIEPLEMRDDLLAAYEMYSWLAPHFHLPLQSGSDRILESMGRPYRAAQFRELVTRIKLAWPLAAVGVDVLAGFPGETEADFRATVELLAALPLSYFHIFPYSRRPGTLAAAFSSQVPEHLKRDRVLELRQLNQAKRRIFAELNVGARHLALVENTPHPPSGRLKLLTGNYLVALLSETLRLSPGTLVPVTLAAAQNPWGLLEASPATLLK